jgi:DNA-binding MarR family transcriptional regulator
MTVPAFDQPVREAGKLINILKWEEAVKETAKASRSVPGLGHDAQVSTLINLAARLTNKVAKARFGELGAWPGQIPILLWLFEKDGVIQRELVQRSGMEQSTLAEHIDRLEKSNLIYREQGSDDKRKYRIFLTPRGKALSRELVAGMKADALPFAQGISKDKLAIFDEVIRQIIVNLERFLRVTTDASKEDRSKSTGRRKPTVTRKSRSNPRLTASAQN